MFLFELALFGFYNFFYRFSVDALQCLRVVLYVMFVELTVMFVELTT